MEGLVHITLDVVISGMWQITVTPFSIIKIIFTVIKVAHRCLAFEKTIFISLDQSSSEESIKKSAMHVIPEYCQQKDQST